MTRVRLVPLLLLFGVSSGCMPDGYVFRVDDSVSIVAPKDREQVGMPVTFRWKVADDLARDLADPSAGAAGFAVLLDQHPQPPGETLAWFARGDDACTAASSCPDLAYLAERRVFTTRAMSITFESVPANSNGPEHLHEVTIFLIDNRGTRLSESTWSVEFRTREEDA